MKLISDAKTIKLTTVFFGFTLIIFYVFWFGAMQSAAEYLYFIKHGLKVDLEQFHVGSIFIHVYYPDTLIMPRHIQDLISLPKLFDSDGVYQLLYHLDSNHFLIEFNECYYEIHPTESFWYGSGLILGQTPLFYIIVNWLMNSQRKDINTEHIIQAKLEEDYLADKITQTIASNIHHELKTPLTAIEALIIKNRSIVSFIIEVLSNNCLDCAVKKAATKKIAILNKLELDSTGELDYSSFEKTLKINFQLMEDSILNMFNTVNMIKDLNVIETGASASIYDIINSSINIFKMGSSYQFTSIIDPKLKNCYLYHLDQHSLSNIIINHTKNSLEAHSQIIKFELVNTLKRKDGLFTKINIIDDGSGMSLNIVDSAYDLKVSTKAYGTGVGLYICKTILNKFGGDERIAYTDKFGTVFEMTLPTQDCEGKIDA